MGFLSTAIPIIANFMRYEARPGIGRLYCRFPVDFCAWLMIYAILARHYQRPAANKRPRVISSITRQTCRLTRHLTAKDFAVLPPPALVAASLVWSK